MEKDTLSMIRVFIVEDHPVVLGGLIEVFTGVDDMRVVGTASSGAQALNLMMETHPDVLITDMAMADMNGVELIRQVQQDYPDVKILALSAYVDRFFVYGVLSQGAHGYLTKDEDVDEIIGAVRAIAHGEKGRVSQRVTTAMNGRTNSRGMDYKKLSKREHEVLEKISEGKTNQRIAMEMGISTKTVERYIDNLFTKLGVQSRVEAAVANVRGEVE